MLQKRAACLFVRFRFSALTSVGYKPFRPDEIDKPVWIGILDFGDAKKVSTPFCTRCSPPPTPDGIPPQSHRPSLRQRLLPNMARKSSPPYPSSSYLHLGNPHPNPRSRQRRQNHHPLPSSNRRSRSHSPHRRFQRRNPHVQKHHIQCLGFRWPRLYKTVLAMLLYEYDCGVDFCD